MEGVDQESIKHICKFCNKSFPCGRSLGGHMRSHLKKLSSCTNNGGSMDNHITDVNASCYELRKHPKKTVKSKDSGPVGYRSLNQVSCSSVVDKLCKECGKGFQSWKALFGHMKCHSNKKNSNSASLNQGSDDEYSDAKIHLIKRSRNSRSNRYIVAPTKTAITTTSSSISMNANHNQISSNNASTSLVSEIEQEQDADVAMSLMMLSRDVGKWGDQFETTSDYLYSSVLVNLAEIEGKNQLEIGPKKKKLAETQVGVDFRKRSVEKTTIKVDEFDSGFGEFGRKFECAACNKSFHSYQALGGHKASHKKLKTCSYSKTQNENKPMLDHDQTINGYDQETCGDDQEPSSLSIGVGCLEKTVVLGAHECSICLKTFSTGQALGGHKRSHLIAQPKPKPKKAIETVGETRWFLDLNMPPEEEEESSSTGYKSYYWKDQHNHESRLLGLLSTT